MPAQATGQAYFVPLLGIDRGRRWHHTRVGSVLSPHTPTPSNTYMLIANTMAEAIFDALSHDFPDAGIAGSSFGIGGTFFACVDTPRYR